jgi:amino acid transporter
VCYIGGEVREPGRTIPRSILISLVGVALIYLLINLAILGVISWREFVPAEEHPAARFIVSVFMERLYGGTVAKLFTALICWTAFGSVFALLLGYSRIPYAAALDGGFFRAFARLHPTRHFPHVSLLTVGALAIGCSFFPLDTVIAALLTTRIVVQFLGQIGALVLLRRHRPDLARPFRMWLYPLPCFVALAGWLFVLATTDPRVLLYGAGSLTLGVVAFLFWARHNRRWPFAPAAPAKPSGG